MRVVFSPDCSHKNASSGNSYGSAAVAPVPTVMMPSSAAAAVIGDAIDRTTASDKSIDNSLFIILFFSLYYFLDRSS